MKTHLVCWTMPKAAADLLRETLDMDCESASFDPRLRRAIARALGQIQETHAVPSSPCQPGEPGNQYYVLEIIGDLEPQLHGPYATEARRDTQAKRLREGDPAQNNGLFRLDITPGGQPEVGGFAGIELQA